jgi:6-phosphofructokinase 2
MSIITLTMNPAIDLATTTEQVIVERKVRCARPIMEAGGGGINVSKAIARLGGESLACLMAGGLNGKQLTNILDQSKISHRAFRVSGETRENLTVAESSSESQWRFVMPGPEVAEQEWRECLDAMSSLDPAPDFLVASGSLPPGVPADFYAHLARICREQEIRLILDTSGDALCRAVEEGVFLVKPNVVELQRLVDGQFEDEVSLLRLAGDLCSRNRVEVVVVSLGSAGALLVTPDLQERIPSPTVPIRSKVGAGDSMVAGIVLGLVRRLPLSQAVRFGVAAGAAAVMTPGSELCRREDTERLFETIKDNLEPSDLGAK